MGFIKDLQTNPNLINGYDVVNIGAHAGRQSTIDSRQSTVEGLSNITYFGKPNSIPQIGGVVGLEVYRNDCKIRRERVKHGGGGCGKRGLIREFSNKSRSRLAFIANNTDIEFKSMLTLTYPKSFPTNFKVYKVHLDNFMRAFKREYGEVAWLWAMEFQRRGAVHYHLFVDVDLLAMGPLVTKGRHGGKADYVTNKAAHDWASQTWNRVVFGGKGKGAWAHDESDKDKHMAAGVSWEVIRDAEGARKYVTKYASKLEQKSLPSEIEGAGRFWGAAKMVKKIKVKARYVATQDAIMRAVAGIDCHSAVKTAIGRHVAPGTLYNLGQYSNGLADSGLMPFSEFVESCQLHAVMTDNALWVMPAGFEDVSLQLINVVMQARGEQGLIGPGCD